MLKNFCPCVNIVGSRNMQVKTTKSHSVNFPQIKPLSDRCVMW